MGTSANIRNNRSAIDEWLAGSDNSLKIETEMTGIGRVMDRAGNVTENSGSSRFSGGMIRLVSDTGSTPRS
jgi:hypothetical protein